MKRPTSHRVGKRLDFQKKKNPFPPIDPLASPPISEKERVMKADKEYKRLKKRVILGRTMIVLPKIYVAVCIVYLLLGFLHHQHQLLVDFVNKKAASATFGIYTPQHLVALPYMVFLEKYVVKWSYLVTAGFMIIFGEITKTNATKEIEELEYETWK